MTLRVDPGALSQFAAQLGRAREDATECRNYVDKHVHETTWYGDGGVFNPLYYAHNDVRETVAGMVSHLAALLTAAEKEMAKAGEFYRTTDHAAAERLDASYPAVTRPVPSVY